MKKILSLLLACFLISACLTVCAVAETNESKTVYVSISDKGNLVAANVRVTATDIDDDGKITINDALYALHEAKYQGGAKQGYSYYKTEQYGLSIGTLWGDKSGCFGYYLNDASAWSLSDEMNDGDRVYAFVYSDTEYWSDSYTFFDKASVSAVAGSEIELTLYKSGYDENWNTVTEPLANASITINGASTDYVTDKDGKVTIKADKAGTLVISAVCENVIIVPPVCVASITSDSDKVNPGDNENNIVFVLIAISAVTAMAVFAKKTRRNEF